MRVLYVKRNRLDGNRMKSALKVEREKRGWSLAHVAKKVGVSNAQVYRIENEGVRSAETARAIAELFNGSLTLDEICIGPSSVEAPEVLEKAS